MVKHTPGPWMIDPKFLSEIQTPNDKTICSAWHQYAAGQEIRVTGVLECSLEESAANARLIAAAPDLLRVAELLVSWLDEDEVAHKLCDAARAAIAKAEGRS